MIKNLSNYPFIINDRRRKKNSTIVVGKYGDESNVEMCRVRVIDGISFLVTIRMNPIKLQIIGDSKDKREIKVIEIERDEALDFLDQECQGKLELLFDHLRYDKEEEVLYLVGNDVEI